MDYKYLTTEQFDDGAIVRISLNRVSARNAQNRGLLVELDHAFLAAEKDDQVRVIILAGNGPMFSAGHDLGSPESLIVPPQLLGTGGLAGEALRACGITPTTARLSIGLEDAEDLIADWDRALG